MGHRYEMVSFGLGFGRLDDPIRSSGVIEPWTEADEGGDRQLDRMVESPSRLPWGFNIMPILGRYARTQLIYPMLTRNPPVIK
jgi:hypothetical protein